MIYNLTPHRPGILVPDTGPTCIRDTDGRIVAVTQFILHD